MLVDSEQWSTEIGNCNVCLHYAITNFKLNLFNMVAIYEVFAFVLVILL